MITIADVLDSAELAAVRDALADDGLFVDGAATAGAGARAVKSNLQGRAVAPPIKAICEKVRRSLLDNQVFSTAALPVRFARVMVSRYEPGMGYGWHTDEALIDNTRTDLSFTLFLSDLASYEGGALEITNSSGTEALRLPAGSVVVYSSGDLHRVTEVTRGQRLAVVGWVQSRIRRSDQRELQFKLAAVRADVNAQAGNTNSSPNAAVELAGIRQELLRMWSES